MKKGITSLRHKGYTVITEKNCLYIFIYRYIILYIMIGESLHSTHGLVSVQKNMDYHLKYYAQITHDLQYGTVKNSISWLVNIYLYMYQYSKNENKRTCFIFVISWYYIGINKVNIIFLFNNILNWTEYHLDYLRVKFNISSLYELIYWQLV